MIKKIAGERMSGSHLRVIAVAVFGLTSGCGAAVSAPEVEELPRRTIVCAPDGIAVTADNTVPVGSDGSCPVGFDTMVWV